HRVEDSISVCAVDRGGVLSVKRHRLADFIEREIGRVRFAFDLEFRKFAPVLSRRRQYPGDARKGPKVGVGEFVGTGNRRGPRIVDVPGAELAASIDFSFWFCVCQYSVEAERLVHAGGTQVEVMDV